MRSSALLGRARPAQSTGSGVGCCGRVARTRRARKPFYAAARGIVASRLEDWRGIWAAGAADAANRTEAFLSAMGTGRADHLNTARLETRSTPDAHSYGMCGYLDVYDLAPRPAAAL